MTKSGDLETQLTWILKAQARSVSVYDREWTSAPVTTPTAIEDTKRAHRVRPFVIATVGIAAVTALAIGLNGMRGGTTTRVATRPPAAGLSSGHSVSWSTKQVSLTADDFSIVAGGTTYTSAGAKVDVHSDPGDSTYQTIELTWQEHGTEMRWYIYLASDGTDWWATEMRTYNGRGDWITYAGDRFRTKLGSAFSGDLNLTATESGVFGELHVHGLRLQAFIRPAACAAGGPPVVVESPYDPIDFERGNANSRILDSVTCTPVADQSPYRVEWIPDDPSVIQFGITDDCGVLATGTCAPGTYASVAAHPGTTTVHLNLIEVATGRVLSTTSVQAGLGDRAPHGAIAEGTSTTSLP